MELHDFVHAIRRKLKRQREDLMETFLKGLDEKTYHATIGRVKQIDDTADKITTILKSDPELLKEMKDEQTD